MAGSVIVDANVWLDILAEWGGRITRGHLPQNVR